MNITLHASERMSQRNVDEADVEFIMCFGRRFHRTGVEIFFLGRRDVPTRGAHQAEHLVGTVVVVSRDSSVITVYRNARALGALKRKQKYDRRENASSGRLWRRTPSEACSISRLAGCNLRAAASNDRQSLHAGA